MALISCPECRREISDQATTCPHCGHPIANQAQDKEPPGMWGRRPKRVRTSEDHAMTRNRGCADLLIIGVIVLIVLLVAVS